MAETFFYHVAPFHFEFGVLLMVVGPRSVGHRPDPATHGIASDDDVGGAVVMNI